MSKYIIKNCTSLDSDGTTCQDCSYEDCGADDCINRTDCMMKQIVELCKNKNYFVKRTPNAQFSSGVQNSELAFDILQLLDIQEVNQ